MTISGLIATLESQFATDKDESKETNAQLAMELYGRLAEHFGVQLSPEFFRGGDRWLFWNLGKLIERYQEEVANAAPLTVVGVIGPVREQD